MQLALPLLPLRRGRSRIFIPRHVVASAAPSVAAKLRLVARYAALAVLADARSGGAYRDRTDDLMLAKQPLSQLS